MSIQYTFKSLPLEGFPRRSSQVWCQPHGMPLHVFVWVCSTEVKFHSSKTMHLNTLTNTHTHTGTYIHIISDLITYCNKSIIVTSQRSRVRVDTTSINLWGPANPHFACSFGFGSDIVKSDDRYWGCLGGTASRSRNLGCRRPGETLPECVGPATTVLKFKVKTS